MATDNSNNEWLSLFPDNSDDDEQSSVAAQRQERIRKAFELSKESYKSELVVLSPSFFHVEPKDVITVANNDRHGLQNLDASIQEAYVNQDYQQALDLCVVYLDGVDTEAITLEGNGSARNRECYDVALRACARIPSVKEGLGLKLIEGSRPLWKAHYTVGVSASHLFLSMGRPRDAISTLLASAPSQPVRYPFLRLLLRSMAEWFRLLSTPTASESQDIVPAIEALYKLLEGQAERTSGPYYYGAPITSINPTYSTPKSTPTDEEIRTWCRCAGFDENEAEEFVTLCTAGSAVAEDEVLEAIGAGGRSVRSL